MNSIYWLLILKMYCISCIWFSNDWFNVRYDEQKCKLYVCITNRLSPGLNNERAVSDGTRSVWWKTLNEPNRMDGIPPPHASRTSPRPTTDDAFGQWNAARVHNTTGAHKSRIFFFCVYVFAKLFFWFVVVNGGRPAGRERFVCERVATSNCTYATHTKRYNNNERLKKHR